MGALNKAVLFGHIWHPSGAFPVALTALSLAMALPAASWADDGAPAVVDADLAYSEAAVGDEVLAQTRGTGEGGSPALPWDDDESGDNGSHQGLDIGSFNAGNGFNDSNAVAVAIVHQHAVQIIGSGGIDDVVGN